MPKIKILKDEVICDGHYFQTVVRHYLGRTGKPKQWEMTRKKSFTGIAAILALTPKNEIILTKTYRVPLKKYVIELCAGLTDKKGESKSSAVKRELLEETGYAVSRVKKVITGPFSSGLSDALMTIYVGFNAKKISDPKLEESEDIETIKIPIKQAHYFLTHPPRNTLVDVKIFSILFILKKIS